MTIKFSKNWNGKLDWPLFTTIRQDKKYWRHQLGTTHDVELNGKPSGRAILVYCEFLPWSAITDALAQADAGLSAKELRAMLEKMYGQGSELELLVWRKV